MTEETIRQSLEFLHKNSEANETIYIEFYGGEPLVEFELLKYGVELSQKLFADNEVKYTITTNVTFEALK